MTRQKYSKTEDLRASRNLIGGPALDWAPGSSSLSSALNTSPRPYCGRKARHRMTLTQTPRMCLLQPSLKLPAKDFDIRIFIRRELPLFPISALELSPRSALCERNPVSPLCKLCFEKTPLFYNVVSLPRPNS